MAARLTEQQKKRIVADYVELRSYNAVAKRHGISDKTVKTIVEKDSEFTELSEQKKEENAKSILMRPSRSSGPWNAVSGTPSDRP